MMRLYYAALVGVAIFLSYFIGEHVANIKCEGRMANARIERLVLDNKIIGETNDTVFHTGVGDIRRILREKYTIAE